MAGTMPMADDLDFYFDFISPYAYLASGAVKRIAASHGRTLNWRPFRLGVAVVKVMGLRPLMETPLKSEYVRRDVTRLARVMGLPLTIDGPIPDPLPPACLVYSSPRSSRAALCEALLAARWAEGKDIGDPDMLGKIADQFGLGQEAGRAALADPSFRQAWNGATENAISEGVFGSPTVCVGGELFWGVDRLPLLDRYLADGGRYTPWANRLTAV